MSVYSRCDDMSENTIYKSRYQGHTFINEEKVEEWHGPLGAILAGGCHHGTDGEHYENDDHGKWGESQPVASDLYHWHMVLYGMRICKDTNFFNSTVGRTG